MKTSLTIGGALLALAAFASTANAGMNAPASFSRGDTRISVTSSIGSARHFGADSRAGSHGLELRTAGSHCKKPIDSDQGGNDDPPKKTPKDPKTSETGGSSSAYPPGSHYGPGWPGYPGGGSSGPPLACRGRVGGC